MKPFKTLDEQIELLQQRGLIISDKEKTKNYLLQQSYYNVINVYSKFFQESENTYIVGSTFEEIRAVHIFDTEIKSSFFKWLIECEKHFKSIVAYRFSETYRDIPLAYLKTESYNGEDLIKLSKTISLLSSVLTSNINDRNKNSIKHYYKIHKDVPLWVLINELTFGQVAHMYKFFNDQLKNLIAKDLAIYLKNNTNKTITVEPKDIERILFNLIDVRNCVAHNNKLFNFKCKNNITYIEEIYSPCGITKKQSRQTPFDCFVIMQLFLEKEQYALFHNHMRKRIKNLERKVTSINIDQILNSLGFPNAWLANSNKLPQ